MCLRQEDEGSESESDDDLARDEDVNWDSVNFRRSRRPRGFQKSPWFVVGLFFKLLTPAIIAIGLFVGIYVMSDRTLIATKQFSWLMSESADQAVILRRTIRATRQAITETANATRLYELARHAEELSDSLTQAHERLAFDAAHRTGKLCKSCRPSLC